MLTPGGHRLGSELRGGKVESDLNGVNPERFSQANAIRLAVRPCHPDLNTV